MGPIRIPPQLADAVDDDDLPARREWLATLPQQVEEIALGWELELGDPYLPGGQCAWVAPASNPAGEQLVLKVGWRHREAEHEADALRLWDGAGAVRCVATWSSEETTALLLERCVPGSQLRCSASEPEQDVLVAALLRRLWERSPRDGHPLGSLRQMCDQWADAFELDLATDARGLDPGLAREGIAMLRDLPRSAERSVLLCTDLHAGNVLASQREPWLVIDPKPFVGDPAYDVVQHMLNCDERLATDPAGLAQRMAELLELDSERVGLWLFARCAQESRATPPCASRRGASPHEMNPHRSWRRPRSNRAPPGRRRLMEAHATHGIRLDRHRHAVAGLRARQDWSARARSPAWPAA